MNNVTNILVEKIYSTQKFEDFSSLTKQNLKNGLFDYIMCCHITANYDPNFKNMLNAQIYFGGDGSVPVIGTGEQAHPYDACLLNGYSAHALDLDDVHSEIRGHPSAVILSLLLTLVDTSKASERFYEAYLIGIEVMTRISKLLGKSHYEKGFHTTATAGLYGAVAAGAYYLAFSKEECSASIDLCVSQVSGSRSHFGTMIKPLHAGWAAQKAWQILHFTTNQIVGSNNTIANNNGLLSMYGKKDSNPSLLYDNWGDSWAVDTPGLWFKLYPCCSANAHPIDATKELIEKYAFDIKKIKCIQLYFPQKGDVALVYTSPKTGEEGRFSAEYCVALLLLGVELSIDSFSVKTIREDVKSLIAKMKRVYDPAIPLAKVSYPKGRYCIVEIVLADGRTYQARTDIPIGSPGKPLKLEDLTIKAKNLLNNEFDRYITLFQQDIVHIADLISLVVKKV
ncbi:hypothetical protein CWR48_11015 [Oceanobacillus arenosus]|uniref:MmgE/PrpD family protein n=1 Tax=Oceanobacillus arenosus TaxID=1229153 RepID=A0A3D8PSZ6_9BACI|nr:MmgE/PrpD family protein [Oceanobacillus arenosus]RDW18115.1 hypothetical protein CWR48_11015 [Oceanobacillus arenosus]